MTIKLRAPEPDDVDRLYVWENDPEGLQHGHWAHAPLSRFQIWEYVNGYDADPSTSGAMRMMVVADGETVGTVDLYDIDLYNRRASVGIYIDSKRRGEGVGRMALESITVYASEALGLHSLQAYCLSENERSRHLFESHGFACSGIIKDCARIGKRFADIVLFNKIL